jgi:hypothetical protein
LVRHANAEIVECLADSPPGLITKPVGKGFRRLFLRMRDRLHLHREIAEKKSELTEHDEGTEDTQARDFSQAINHGATANNDEAHNPASTNSRKAAADAASSINGVAIIAPPNSDVPVEGRPAVETSAVPRRPEKGSVT